MLWNTYTISDMIFTAERGVIKIRESKTYDTETDNHVGLTKVSLL